MLIAFSRLNLETIVAMSERDLKTEEEHKIGQDEAGDEEVREGPFCISSL